MAKRAQKAGKRATAPKRAGPVREPKSGKSKPERPKSEIRAARVRQTASAGIPRTAGPQKIIEELQRRLDESSRQQTATADVLKVISRSAFDLQTVLETLVKSAMALCDAHTGAIFQKRGDLYHMTAGQGYSPEMLTYAHDHPLTPGMGSNVGRVALTGKVVQIGDVEADPDYQAFGYQRVGHYRAMLGVPIMRDGKVDGVFSLARPEPGPFTERQVELVQTFADQAMIAIENTRLFNETREALEHQTATSEVLQVISSSMADAQPVFERILDCTERLFDVRTAAVFLAPGDGLLHLAARRGIGVASLDAVYPMPMEQTAGYHVIRERRQMYFPDVINGENVPFSLRRAGHAMGNFSNVITPMFWQAQGVGTISVTREPNVAFSDKELRLLQTFADQAVIAIENARLFNEVQKRTKELSQSLDDLRTAQDRLVQTEKLASLGQLTAGIAHEIKNPLNFVNNFSALSAELTDELNDVLKPAALDDRIREEVDGLTLMLKDNLKKVVQHGKRADSIVKNMLLHSREGSGEQRPTDINTLLDESLNLAYHGARAEKPGFNITLQRDFAAGLGAIEAFPQEITRAFLNLISNGFYAATRRKTENGGSDFEPVLSAATKNLGDRVEVRIRDNGTGISAEVKDKMFNPFFTTKPAGEGTGLGLSMSHDIIVKQHGGTIEVETEQGQFTEFRIILPRKGPA